jgi:2-polyprenyl-3-methyl-5-hydroxy-6-metoxy-1,4-benzoquinol methylase/Tfp pilus assembly protein PilF
MASPRILTFNFHEPYLCLMARLGLPMTVGLYRDPPFAREWQTRFRPVPPVYTFVEEQVWRGDLAAGRFDLVITHNELNAANLYKCGVPAILVCHNRRSFLETTVSGDPAEGRAKYEALLAQLQEKFSFVFISESKRDDYRLPGRVIRPGIDVDAYGGYRGDVAEVLRVGNAMRARNLMFDVDFQETVCRGIPHRVAGEDPAIPGATPSESFDHLLDLYRSRRCLLHVTRQEYEDGYNLAMLEAMACGMPVVSLANRTSPLTDGVDGFVSDDASVLATRLQALLDDVELARTVGARGRETVARAFPMEAFLENWRTAIEEAAAQPEGRRRKGMETKPDTDAGQAGGMPRLRLLMHTPSAPGPVFECLADALRRHHEVAAATGTRDIATPEGFSPDLFVHIDSECLHPALGVDQLECPKVCYLTSESAEPPQLADLARPFDFCFVTREESVRALVAAEVPNVAWLPLEVVPGEDAAVTLQERCAARADHLIQTVLEALGVFGGHEGESRFRMGGYYCAPRQEIAVHVPAGARRVLDVGCGGGEFGHSLKRRGVQEVVGIEVVERAWKIAKQTLDDAILGNIEAMELPFDDGYFDCVVFGDVLEHLVWPAKALQKVARVLAPDGVIVMSIPNVRFWQSVVMHVHGRWHYEDAGIMDRTHLRFFTAPEMQELVKDAGLDLITLAPLSMWPRDQLPLTGDNALKVGKMTFGPLNEAEIADFLTYQYLVIAGKPNADRLAAARRALDEKDSDRAYRLAAEAAGVDEFERKCIMAKAVARSGKLDTAASLYREALALRPDATAVEGELGIVLVASNQPAEAKPFLERALMAEPDNNRIVGAMGLVLLTEGRAGDAFAHLVKALELEFDTEALLAPLVQTARECGRLEEAVGILRKFVDFYPGKADAGCRLAELLAEQGAVDEAKDRLETILLLNPEHGAARELLARLADEP